MLVLGGGGLTAESACRWRTAVMFFCTLLLIGAGARCPSAEDARRDVLLLYSNESFLPASEAVAHGFRRVLQATERDRPMLYSESLDAVRFPGAEHEAGFASFLSEKYAATQLDLVATIGPQALAFALERRSTLFPHAAIVFMGINEVRAKDLPPPNTTGVVSRFDPAKTVELALALQPDASHLAVVTGAADFDKEWEETARRELKPFESRLQIDYLSGLPLRHLLFAVSHLPPNSILLYLSVFQDGTGERFIPRDVAQKLAAAANAPVYSVYETLIDHGIVGGYVASFEAMGAEAAK